MEHLGDRVGDTERDWETEWREKQLIEVEYRPTREFRVEDFFLLQEAREGEQCVQSEDQESGEGGEEFGAASPATSVSSLSSLSDSEEEGEECLTLSLVSSVPSLSVQIADLQSPDDLPSDEDQREPESTAHLSARPAAPEEEEEEELLDYEEEMALQLPQEEYLDMGWDRQLPEWVGR
ncbi:hypothetical protein ACOMHN_014580 [Nucella lapillus]